MRAIDQVDTARWSEVTARSRLRIEVHGAVQGVGFRPFVYRLARELGLTGWVINDARGVFIEVEGPLSDLRHFDARLRGEGPPLAVIQSVESTWLEAVGYDRFEIRHSQADGAKTVLVLPDVATCADCRAEIFDPSDRRHRYPFTNCTNCGPRFTIINALPYDRPNTTMQRFTMCPACRTEYENPADRRFHAQPNACRQCGPHLALWSPAGAVLVADDDSAVLARAAEALRRGLIVAVKGLGGFHLMVDAQQTPAVACLRDRKQRPAKPLAVMARDLAQIRGMCAVTPEAAAVLSAPEAPIVLLPRRMETPVAANVAPASPTLGVMLAYTPLHHLLLRQVDFPVVATSGNLSDEPICTDESDAVRRLGHVADLFLVHDRPITRHADDSIVWMLDGRAHILRRARGYAPLPILAPRPLPIVLGVGAHLKNCVALSVDRQVFISQHIGDLETVEAMAAFERVIADLTGLYEVTPVAVAHDMHPDYLSTRWAESQVAEGAESRGGPDIRRVQLVPVQHHHAHLAACLADNGVVGPALGVTWDGTGYGTDGTVWGGEFLLGDAVGYRRVAHLRPFRLPGGEAAIREPRRIALSLLWEMFGDEVLERDDLAPLQSHSPAERRVVARMLQRGVNSPLTTSVGRLFDGVAALVGLQQKVTYEGEAAMALEYIADDTIDDAYRLPLVFARDEAADGAVSAELDWEVLVRQLLADLQHAAPASIVAARFHNALVEAVVSTARWVGEARVALSGGCFQNRWLVERSAARLRASGFEVLLHRHVPPNDGCISLGQVMVAAAILSGQ